VSTVWRNDRWNEFWRFIAERHEIFRRRVILRQPPPWTEDPILASVAFTNIYRELDRTTRVLMGSIPPNATDHDVLFNVIKFRFFTWPPTYWAIGEFRDWKEWPWYGSKRVDRILVKRQEAGHQIFTGAFMVTSLGAQPGIGGKARLVVRRISWVRQHLDSLMVVFKATSMADAHSVLEAVPGFGGFMAYEVLTDLTYTGRVPYTRDQWVYVGPGAIKGLRELVQPSVKVTQKIGAELIQELRTFQHVGFSSADVKLNGPRLTLENVEQALCEFQKYQRAKSNGHVKRRYSPLAANQDLSVWQYLPPLFT